MQSCFSKSEAAVLIDLTTKSTIKLVVEPPATVVLGLSGAIHDVLRFFVYCVGVERVETVVGQACE